MNATLETTQTIPLTTLAEGTIRIADTRVNLETVVYHFNLGATPEQIVHKFPALRLVDVYAVTAYYLAHRQTVDDYIRQQDAKAEAVRATTENNPEYRAWKDGLRERLLVRQHEAA